MTDHAKLSASSAHRWSRCPGSIAAEEPFPDTSSVYADEGTAAHMVASRCLETSHDADRYLGWLADVEKDKLGAAPKIVELGPRQFIVDDDMVHHVQEYVDLVREVEGNVEGGTLFVEQRVEFDEWVPEGYGTADAVILSDISMHIFDLKYGRGVEVLAEDNDQAVLYALGALQSFAFLGLGEHVKSVSILISQPRKHGTTTWTLRRSELEERGRVLSKAADLALAEDAERIAGEKQCQFCRAKTACSALGDKTFEALTGEFADWERDLTLDDPKEIGENRRSEILAYKKMIEGFLKAIQTKVENDLLDGKKVPGWKMVAGRSNREWADEKDALRALKRTVGAANAVTTKVISPTQAEKLLGKGHGLLARHVTKPAGKPTLAPESDKKESVLFSPEDEFANIK